MQVKTYSDLIVWQKAVALVTSIYELTAKFPRREQFSLSDQLQRAAVSIPSNIAEGQGRLSTREFLHSLGTARGSLFEVETQIIIARNLGYATDEEVQPLLRSAGEVGRILNGLIESLREGLKAEAAAH